MYDISGNTPLKKQVVKIPNTYAVIVFDPSGTTFYTSGGQDDNVHIYDFAGAQWSERVGSPIPLGHAAGNGLAVSPEAAGLAITSDGTRLLVADYYNDSVTLLAKTNGAWSKVGEIDLRPGKLDPANSSGVPGGEYPFWIAIGSNNTAYVSSLRDREIVVLSLAGQAAVTSRIKVSGQPNRLVLNADSSRLYVAEEQTDSVDVIDTAANRVIATVRLGAPAGLLPNSNARYNGHNTNSLTLSPDGSTLYVTNGSKNSVAAVDLKTLDALILTGLIPTGWYPTSVSTNADGSHLYVVNAKSPTGPNLDNCKGLTTVQRAACQATNQYNLQLIKAGLQSLPTPSKTELWKLTTQVASNDHFERKVDAAGREKTCLFKK